LAKNHGRNVTVLLFNNLRQRGQIGEFSGAYLIEHDCKGNRLRVLSSLLYPGRMNTGEILLFGKLATDWQTIADEGMARDITNMIYK
jgi:hypothetical protein